MATPSPDSIDRRRHRGVWRFLYMDLKAFLRRYLGWG
jgi:hypothetical protein